MTNVNTVGHLCSSTERSLIAEKRVFVLGSDSGQLFQIRFNTLVDTW